MSALRQTSSGRPAAIPALLAALILSALITTPAASQVREPARDIPSACRPTLAAFVTALSEADRRLRPTGSRPDAARLQAAILAETLARPDAGASLAALLACLAQR